MSLCIVYIITLYFFLIKVEFITFLKRKQVLHNAIKTWRYKIELQILLMQL